MGWDNPTDGTSDRGWVKWRFLPTVVRDWLSLFFDDSDYNEMEMLPFVGSGAGAHKTTTVIDGDIIAEEMGVDDELYVFWHFPKNLDKTWPIQVEVSWYMPDSEADKLISGDISFTLVDGDPINVSTDTIQMVDEPAPATAYIAKESLFPIDLPSYPEFDSANHLNIKFTRVASSADPGLANKPRLHHICIHYRRGKV